MPTAAAALRDAGVTTLRPHSRLRLSIAYSLLGAVEQELRQLGLRAPEATYGAQVTLTILVPTAQHDLLCGHLADLSAGQAEITTEGIVYL